LNSTLLGKKSVQGQEAYQIPLQAKVERHMENPGPQGCILLALVAAYMHEPLVDAEILGNSKRSQKRTGQADDGSPAVTPEIRRLALSFRILMKGDHAGHSLAVFWNIGVIPLQHDSPVDRHEFLLRYNERLPARDDIAERPGRRSEKIRPVRLV
jgi:hypothetical protein